MIDPARLEESFKEFTNNLNKWVPDGITTVNLQLLHSLGLLNHEQFEKSLSTDNLSHYFHVVETPEKVTLFNDQFAIWIVPQPLADPTATLTFISLIHAESPHLEIVFSTSGVYNTPKYILKILQNFLADVQDVEAMISLMDKKETG